MAERFSGDDLLAHLESYGVVVCKSCQFAIQPSALPSHLLRHRIYRNERRQLLQRLSKLKLLEPEEVPLPSTNSEPLPNLSVHQGFRCLFDGCEHACVSSKRMSQHWSELHDEHDSRNVKARAAFLQTFFRGNKIRYFEVNGAGHATTRASSSKDHRIGSISSTSNSPPGRKQSLASASSSSNTPDNGNGPIPEEPTVLTLDMNTLQYFHHYIINTALTCRRSESESEYFWKVQIPQFAFRHPFLMFSIVGLSALHQSVLALDNPVVSNLHREAAIQYQNSALIDFRSAVRLPDVENSTALIAFGRFFGVQRCVQHQIDWILYVTPAETTPDKEMSKLLEFFFLLRGEHEMLLTLQHLLPQGSDLLLTEESMSGLSNLRDRKSVTPEQLVDIPMEHVQRLTGLPSRLMPLIAKQENPEALPEQHEPAMNGLLMAFALSYASPADMRNLWDGAEGWVRTLPDQYIHMLSAAQPGALVIFAHWLILAQRLEEHYWFLKGQAIRLHTIVMNNLPSEEWKCLVRDLF